MSPLRTRRPSGDQPTIALRDFLAAAALQGSLAHGDHLRLMEMFPGEGAEAGMLRFANGCYLLADAMLTARTLHP